MSAAPGFGERLRSFVEPPATTDAERSLYASHALRRFARGYARGAAGGAIGATVATIGCLLNDTAWGRVGAVTGALLVAALLCGRMLARRWADAPRSIAWYNAGVGVVASSGVGVATAVGEGFSSWGSVALLLFWLYGAVVVSARPRYMGVGMVAHATAFCLPVLLLRSADGFGPFALVTSFGAAACFITAWIRDAADLHHYIAILRSSQAQRDIARTNAELERVSEELASAVDAQLATVLERRRDVQRLHRMLHAPEVDRAGEIATALERQPIADATSEPYKPGALVGGRARIESFVASGGFGDVFLAVDLTLREEVVVKVMRAPANAEPSRLKRFLLEAAAAAAVDHRAIVRVFHVDVDARGSPFLICERIVGRPLSGVIEEGALPPFVALAVVSVVVDALCAVHRAGLVHRDVKPENIMLSAIVPGVRLLDFGVSQWMAEDFDLTNAGELIGSLGYMAPERFRSRDTAVGPASDVFAVGMLLYECLAGAHPLAGLETFALVAKMSGAELPSLRARAPDVPPELADFIASMLAAEPEARPDMPTVATALTVLQASLPAVSPMAAVNQLMARGRQTNVATSGTRGEDPTLGG